ncbi:MAG: metallophosphoesterase family protein [Planctomycetota bacterium]
MQIAVLGDVHGNLEALDVVLADAKAQGVERFLQVGDVVGYGPDPGACIARLRELGTQVCIGNHDAAVIGRLPQDLFNPFARMAIQWTRSRLDEDELQWLAALPLFLVVFEEDLTLVHGSMHEPEEFDYVRSLPSAKRSMEAQQTAYCFVGHTHLPCAFTMNGMVGFRYRPEFEENGKLALDGNERALINVGSVGQPRDEDPRTGYVLFDTERRSFELRRLPYPIAETQATIRDLGLPEVLAERLTYGL